MTQYMSGSVEQSGFQTLIDSFMSTEAVAEGWTYGGGYASRTFPNGASVSVYIVSALAYLQVTFYDNTNSTNRTFYLYTGTTASAGLQWYTLSIGPGHFFCSVRGPVAGATGARSGTYGSCGDSCMITEFEPFDNTEAVGKQVVFLGGQAASVNGNGIEPSPLICAPKSTTYSGTLSSGMLISPASISASYTFGGPGIMALPYDVLDTRSGPRGRLQNLLMFHVPTPLTAAQQGYLYEDATGRRWRAQGWGVGVSSNYLQRPIGSLSLYSLSANIPAAPIVLIPAE
jgi:hypothetical protein